MVTQTDLTCASLQDMQEQLDQCHQVINDSTMRFSPAVATFTEESLDNNEIVKFYTGLPNLKVLKAVFDLSKSPCRVVARVSFRILCKGGQMKVCRTIGGHGYLRASAIFFNHTLKSFPREGKPDPRGGECPPPPPPLKETLVA